MLNYSGIYTDFYQLTMAETYFRQGSAEKPAVFDYFFRNLPFGAGFAVFAGLEDLLAFLINLKFTADDLSFLQAQGFTADFLQYLRNFRFTGTVRAVQEGEVVFPGCPLVSVTASIIEAQLIETALLNILNFQTLIATKAQRIRIAAGEKILVDFGLRRAHGAGGYYASRAAFIGGFNSTSNVMAARDYQIPVSGTMSHAYIQSFADELSAFKAFVQYRPIDCILLVDTYDTLHSGVPNAILVAQEMEANGTRLYGIRLDSGDLLSLSCQARQMLDNAGLHYVKIAASNDLEELQINELMVKGAPIDIFGVGTNLVTGKPDAALNGVYKLVEFDTHNTIKISENTDKITLPGCKQVFRHRDNRLALWTGDVIALAQEKPKSNGSLPLLNTVMHKGERVHPPQNLHAIATFVQESMSCLPLQYKRLHNPEIYPVSLSAHLQKTRDDLIHKYRGA